jgi:arginine:ornithine antiporter/lysine permease
LVTFLVVGAFAFKFDLLTADIWGTNTMVYGDGSTDLVPLGGTMSQIVAMMLVTVWVFSGVEGASVFSQRARRRSDVGRATVIGFLFVLALYVLINVMSYGIMSQTEVSGLADPSLAGVFAAVVGPWGAKFIAIGLIISLLGVLLSWVLLSTEILRVPATEGIMPRSIGKLNEHGTPTVALWASNICAQVALVLTFFSASTYEVLIFLAAGVILIPYLWAALFQLKTALKAERITQGKSLTYERVIGALAVIYAIWLLYAGRDYILPSAAVYLVLIPLFIKARREAGDTTLFKPFEWVVLGVLALMTAVFIVQVATGTSGF